MKKGIGLIEIIIVVGILLTLIGIASVGATPVRDRASLDTSVSTLITDIKGQQIKAMVGDTEGRPTPDAYGVYFDGDSYVLFHGPNYSAADSSNFRVNLDDALSIINVLFPASQVIFASGSGEIVGFSGGNNQVTIRDNIIGKNKTLTINRYGAIISAN